MLTFMRPSLLTKSQDDLFASLLARARQGDDAALDQLLERYYPVVQEMVHRSLSRDLRTKRPWLIARFSTGDVVQEVFRSVLTEWARPPLLRRFAHHAERSFASWGRPSFRRTRRIA